MRKGIIHAFCLVLSSVIGFTQSTESEKLNTQPWTKTFMEGLDVGGYYRMIYTDRILDNAYDGIGTTRQISVVDPTYYDPMLFLYLGGNPTPNSSFGAELRVDNYMIGATRVPLTNFALFNGLVLRANTATKHAGKYDIRFGGIEWVNMTPFTFGGNTGFHRYSIFERRPWDPGGNVIKRPADYYHKNTINQDVRFGTNAFKGLLVNVTDLPKNFSANLLYGTSQNINGYDREATVMPRKVYGAKLEKTLANKTGTLGVSTYNTVAYLDSIQQEYDTRRLFRMVETYANLDFKEKFKVFVEAGYAANKEPQYAAQNSFAFLMDIKTKKELTYFPISLRAYRMDKNFVNLDSYVGNTTITPYLQNLFSQNPGNRQPNNARLTNSGYLVNNRIGGNVSADLDLMGLKLTGSLELSKDIERFSTTNNLTYGHRINGLEISRFVPFPNPLGDFGPNARMNTFFRGAYETVQISDTASDGGMRNKLTYTSIDVQAKYKVPVGKKDLYFFTLNTFSAVNDKAFYDNAFINASYHEFELYYQLWRDVSLSFYHGIEFVKGNEFTDQEVQADGSLEARNQTGKSWGVGVDYQMNDKTFLYLRQRWFGFDDTSFVGENFKGRHLSVELKIFF